MDRRNFVKASVGSAVAVGLAGCVDRILGEDEETELPNYLEWMYNYENSVLGLYADLDSLEDFDNDFNNELENSSLNTFEALELLVEDGLQGHYLEDEIQERINFNFDENGEIVTIDNFVAYSDANGTGEVISETDNYTIYEENGSKYGVLEQTDWGIVEMTFGEESDGLESYLDGLFDVNGASDSVSSLFSEDGFVAETDELIISCFVWGESTDDVVGHQFNNNLDGFISGISDTEVITTCKFDSEVVSSDISNELGISEDYINTYDDEYVRILRDY